MLTSKKHIRRFCILLIFLVSLSLSGITSQATEYFTRFLSVGNEVAVTPDLSRVGSVSLSTVTPTYTGSPRKPTVVCYDTEGNLISSEHYKVVYPAGCTNVGTYTVKIVFDSEEYCGTITKKFKIIPPKPGSLSISSSSNNIAFKWARITSQITGYQVAYSQKSTFPSASTTYTTIRDSATNYVKLKGLAVSHTYYLKVRSFSSIDGTTYFSAWTTAKSVLVQQGSLSLDAKSAIIMTGGTKAVLYKKNVDTRRANASTTKMMTAILALENKSLSSKVKITSEASNTPYSRLGASVVGDTIVMKDLLHMALLPSDNGAATALAIHTAGSTSAFVGKMNAKAVSLGMKNTQFKNVHGLDANGHYSSARDLAILADYCMKNTTFASIVKKSSYSFQSVNRGIYYNAVTTNMLLGNVSGVIGMKTGTEANSGYCFVCAYRHGGKTYYIVVLGCSSDSGRWSDTRKLITYIDNNL